MLLRPLGPDRANFGSKCWAMRSSSYCRPPATELQTYYKPTHSAHLLVKNFLSKIDRGAPITQEKFLARAWQAANEKAHELGWIIDPGR